MIQRCSSIDTNIWSIYFCFFYRKCVSVPKYSFFTENVFLFIHTVICYRIYKGTSRQFAGTLIGGT